MLDKIRKDIKDLQSRTREDKKKDRQTQLLDVSAGGRGARCVDCLAKGQKVSGKSRSAEADRAGRSVGTFGCKLVVLCNQGLPAEI